MKPLPSTAPAIATILKELHDAFWELDADEKSQHIRYTEDDVMHATKIFIHVLSNVSIHKMMEDGLTAEEGGREHGEHGKRIRQLVIDMTGFDPHDFYSSLLRHE